MKLLHRLVITALLLSLALFSSCTDASIGKRAIVKAIFIDYTDNEYEAAIVVLSYEPTSQIAEIKESAEVYTSRDKSLERAIAGAEALQSKTPFYSQNELLILSTGAVGSFNEIISFFSSEDAFRQGMAVFIASKSTQELKDANKQLPRLIKQCESDSRKSRKIFEIYKQEDGYADILPMLEFGTEQTDFLGVNTMVCIKDNRIRFEVQKDDVQLVRLLQGNTDKIEMTDIGENSLTFKADDIYLTYEIIKEKNLKLRIGIKGNIRTLSAGGKAPQNKDFADKYEKEINSFISEACYNLIERFIAEEMDAFGLKWHFDMYNKKQSDKAHHNSAVLNSKEALVSAEFKII